MANIGEVTLARRRVEVSAFRLAFDLFKVRIGLAIGLTALTGIAITQASALPSWRSIGTVIGVALASAAAGAFNQFAERDIDARMRRTRARAFVTGRLHAGWPWAAAILALGVFGVALVAVSSNPFAALFTFLGAFTYGVVYTLWLKRRSAWNIVIGGLAGSFAVLAGAASVAPHDAFAPAALALALILFLWTPPHFWSLAIAYREDYAAAGVPMLPVVTGSERAAHAVLAASALLVLASALPLFLGMRGVYLAGAGLGGALLLWRSVQLARAPCPRSAMTNFHASLVQLSALLLSAIVDAAMLQ